MTGIPQRQFPQEVIDVIISQLHKDAAALRQCALAASAFVRTSQRLLFHTVHLDKFYVAHAQSRRLYQTLIGSPHLRSFVRELHVLDSPSTASGGSGVGLGVVSWVVQEAKFVALFSMLPNLQYLDLSSFYTLDWRRLPEVSENGLSDALGSIPKIKLSNIRNFPVTRFKNFSSLKGLTLDHVHFDSNSDKQIPVVSTSHQGYLDFLRFSQNSCDGVQSLVKQLSLPTSSLAITQLRRLSITGYLPEVFVTASTVIRASSCALEDLRWQMNAMESTDLDPSLEAFDLGMASKLRRLSLSFVFTGSLGENPQLQWLLRNLISTQLVISGDLERLEVRITLLTGHFRATVESVSDHKIWEDLDSALAAPRYSKLRRASFFVDVGWKSKDTSKRDRLSVELARKMPLLNNKHVLVLVI